MFSSKAKERLFDGEDYEKTNASLVKLKKTIIQVIEYPKMINDNATSVDSVFIIIKGPSIISSRSYNSSIICLSHSDVFYVFLTCTKDRHADGTTIKMNINEKLKLH